MEWSTIVSSVVGVPLHILPHVMDTRYLMSFCYKYALDQHFSQVNWGCLVRFVITVVFFHYF